MRAAALYDIHGNLPALEAVLEEARAAAVDLVVVGGDVLPGPMPDATLDCLMRLEIAALFIRGNGDREVLAALGGTASGAVPEAFRPVIEWTARQLRSRHVERIAGWPATLTVDVPDVGDVLFCHATPRSDTELFTRLTAEAQIAAAFEGLTSSIIVCGHTHMPFDRRIGGRRVINAGSVGMPFGAPGAHWLLLSSGGVEFRHTGYDLSAAAERIRATDYPQAADFAANNVLNPPAEAQMLEFFSRGHARG